MKKIFFLVILVVFILIMFVSCINENKPLNSNIDEQNDISKNDDKTLDLDISENEENSNNDTKNDKNNDTIRNLFLSDVPYDKSIEYITNINGNSAIGANVVEDEEYIYYVNIKDEKKLYRIKKDGKDNRLIFGERVAKLQYYNEKIYFLRFEKVGEEPSGFPIYDSYVCSIDRDGNNFEEIIKDGEIRNFIVFEDRIYYIAYSGLGEGYILPSGQYDLYCYDTGSKEKSTIYEIIQIGDIPRYDSSLISNKNNIYFETIFDGIVEYNIETNESRVILNKKNEYYTDIKGLMIYDNKLIFDSIDKFKSSDENEELLIEDLRKSNEYLLNIFSIIRDSGRILCANSNNNYIFFAYTLNDEVESEKSKVTIVRVKHDGSEAVKIKELTCREIYHLPVGEIYLVNDKLIFFNSHYLDDEINEMIKVMDFDGNELDWDISL